MGEFAAGRIHRNSDKYTFRQIHHITAIRSNIPIRHCSVFSLWAIPICYLWSAVCSPSYHLSKWNGFPGWRYRPTRPTLLVTRPRTTVTRILKILRKSRKNRTTIIFSPMWSEQKGLFWRLRPGSYAVLHMSRIEFEFRPTKINLDRLNWFRRRS